MFNLSTPPQDTPPRHAPRTAPKPRPMQMDEDVYDPYSGDFVAISKYLVSHHPDKFQRLLDLDGTWNGRVFVKETRSGYPSLIAPSLRMKRWPTRPHINQCFTVESLHAMPTHLDGDLSRGFQLLDCKYKDGGNINYFLNEQEVLAYDIHMHAYTFSCDIDFSTVIRQHSIVHMQIATLHMRHASIHMHCAHAD